MIIENRKLMEYYEKAIEIVKNIIGKEEYDDYAYKVKWLGINKITQRLGICKRRIDYKNGEIYCEIEVNKELFELGGEKLLIVLIHEILHTFSNTRKHDKQWQYYAKQISDNSSYTIIGTEDLPKLKKDYK